MCVYTYTLQLRRAAGSRHSIITSGPGVRPGPGVWFSFYLLWGPRHEPQRPWASPFLLAVNAVTRAGFLRDGIDS